MNLKSAITSNRGIQFIVGAALLAVNAKLIHNRSAIGSSVATLNQYAADANITSSAVSPLYSNLSSRGLYEREDVDTGYSSLVLDRSSWKSSIVALTSGALTTANQPTFSILPKLFFKDGIEISYDALSTSFFGISSTQLSYLGTLISSEFSTHILYFVSFVYQVAKVGSWNCDSVENLLDSYNLTGGVTDSILSNFYDLGDLTGSNSSIESIIGDVASGLFSDISGSYNLTQLQDQSKLLINLSSDCKTKKASIFLAVLGWFTYILSTTAITSSAVALYTKLKSAKDAKLPSDDESKDENKDEDQETPDSGEEAKAPAVTKSIKLVFNPSSALLFPEVVQSETKAETV